MESIITIILFCVLLTASFYDLRDRIIPNPLIGAGLGCALVLAFMGVTDWSVSLPAGVGIVLLLQVIRACGSGWFESPGIGMGDVKLLFVVALFLGWEVFWIFYLAVMLAGLVAVIGLLAGWIDRKTPLPFAPFITLAVLVGLFWVPWKQMEGWMV